MLRTGLAKCGWLYGGALLACSLLPAQKPEPTLPPLITTGQIVLDGRSTPYRIRHLPSPRSPTCPKRSPPCSPAAAASFRKPTRRAALKTSSTPASRRPAPPIGPSSAPQDGTVSLLVYFSSAPEKLQLLASAPETERLQVHDVSGVLGFNWGIDPASPQADLPNPVGHGASSAPHRPRRPGRHHHRPPHHLPLLPEERMDQTRYAR